MGLKIERLIPAQREPDHDAAADRRHAPSVTEDRARAALSLALEMQTWAARLDPEHRRAAQRRRRARRIRATFVLLLCTVLAVTAGLVLSGGLTSGGLQSGGLP